MTVKLLLRLLHLLPSWPPSKMLFVSFFSSFTRYLFRFYTRLVCILIFPQISFFSVLHTFLAENCFLFLCTRFKADKIELYNALCSTLDARASLSSTLPNSLPFSHPDSHTLCPSRHNCCMGRIAIFLDLFIPILSLQCCHT